MCFESYAEENSFEMSIDEYREYYRDCTGESIDERDDIDLGTAYHEFYDDDEFDETKYNANEWASDPQ